MLKQKSFIIGLVLSLLIPTSIFAWGSATHSYYANALGKGPGYLNLQEMYGAMVPDMFNTMFGSPYFDYLWAQSHEEFQKVVRRAITSDMKAFAFGYASHNDVWGADYTAHHDGCTTPGIGYVYAQIALLTPIFAPAIEQILLDNGIDPMQAKYLATQFAPSVAHDAVETAVDVLIKRNEDPAIGARMIAAAQLRSPAVPLLLIAAYATGFAREFGLSFVEASGIIVAAEQGFQEFATQYGYIFTKSEAELIQLVSVYGAELASSYLKAATGLDISVPPEKIADLLIYTLGVVESSYADEIAATLAYLENEMPDQSIKDGSLSIAAAESELESEAQLTPSQFSLSQNYPNPFNPTTAIDYSLAKDSQVKLTVYNNLGQVVAVLVNGIQPSGSYSVAWNATNQPSGLYLCRFEADGFTATRKMFLQK